jgi:hypothetical protein
MKGDQIMKNLQSKIALFLVLVVLSPLQAVAVDSATDSAKADTPTSSSRPTDSNKPATPAPSYKPPLRGAPAGRVGGGTRGATERESFALQVLTPDHIGYTSKDQPCLYWFISKPTAHSVEMTITERNGVQPLFTKVIAGPAKGGIQEFCIANYGVHLKPEVPYKWFVALVTDKEDRSKDILAGGMIQRIEASKSLQDKLISKESGPRYSVFAEEGFWFDSFEAITKDITGSNSNADLIRQRTELLKQVGLAEVADTETARQ